LAIALTALVAALAACGGGGSSEAPVTTVAPPAETGASAGAAPQAATTTGPGAPFRASLETPDEAAAVSSRWHYRVTAEDASGEPLRAKITVEIVDPLQQAHPVDYDGTTDPIVDRPFDGGFSDYVDWPAESRGVPLTFRVTIEAQGEVVHLTYPVTPK
jgi:hypothetical protein